MLPPAGGGGSKGKRGGPQSGEGPKECCADVHSMPSLRTQLAAVVVAAAPERTECIQLLLEACLCDAERGKVSTNSLGLSSCRPPLVSLFRLFHIQNLT